MFSHTVTAITTQQCLMRATSAGGERPTLSEHVFVCVLACIQLNNHGELQEAMVSLADQVTILDDKYRTLSLQKRQDKVR